jgi:hypothetical protein
MLASTYGPIARLCLLVVVENESAHFNALAGLLVLFSWVDKCRVRDPSRTSVHKRVIALDQSDLIRALGILEVPPVVGVRPNLISLALAVGIDERCRDEIGVRDGVTVGDCQRVLINGLDGAPHLFMSS